MSTVCGLYSVRDVARLFGLKESRIRYWAQTGFINPSGADGGRRLYTFRDLVAVRAAVELLDGGVPLQRVRRNLQALRASLPDVSQPLSKLRVCSDGEQLVVDDGGDTFEPVTGQLLLDFEINDLETSVVRMLRHEEAGPAASGRQTGPLVQAADPADSVAGQGEPTTAYAWFLAGCAAEADADSAAAIRAYRNAIGLDPGLAAAQTNLGNLLYAGGERQQALACYRRASELEPDQPQAHYNLGNLFDEDGELEMAVAQYRRAVRLDPDFADAHFNLALALENMGLAARALEHWQRYLALAQREREAGDDAARWMEVAQERVALLSETRQPC